ncbi:MAG: D-2-hydroxyacid dehydrogenase [Gemmatimonadota bacterium]
MTRKLLVWMYAPGYPQWTMPEVSVAAIRESLGREWVVGSLRVPVFAAGDGAGAAPPELLTEMADVEVYIGFGVPREAFEVARRLRWVHSGAAGVGAALFPAVRASGVVLTNSAGVHAEPLAEFAIAAMLHFGRGLDAAGRGKRARAWLHREISAAEKKLFELSGRTVGIVGYGAIGSAVGRRAAGLGMRVLALRRRWAEPPPPEVSEQFGREGVPRLLRASDVVVLTLPETPQTRGLIGVPELDAMREGAVLINVSRGGIVDEEALVAALRAGRLRGAALDVFRREPLPPESPLWSLENVLITPHVAALSPRFWERETGLILRNISRYLAGEPLENTVSKELGY